MTGVPVVGLGGVSALGASVAAMRAQLHALGCARAGAQTDFFPQPELASEVLPTALTLPVFGVEMADAELADRLGVVSTHRVPRAALLALLACREAMGAVAPGCLSTKRVGLLCGSTAGGMDCSEREYRGAYLEHRAVRASAFCYHPIGSLVDWLAEQLGGLCYTLGVSTACSSGANAILLGAQLVASGRLDYALVGGVEALTQYTLNGFCSLGLTSARRCRPFDRARDGLNLGEGAAFLLLASSREVTRSRYRYVGGANANDAYHQTGSSPEGRGPAEAMRGALQQAGVAPGAIAYIHAHGTATPTNDSAEYRAMRNVFGELVPAYSSTKGYTGHTLGAAGALGSVLAILALEEQTAWPNVGFAHPFDGLAHPPAVGLTALGSRPYAMTNSFGFGGNCTSLIFERLG